MPTALLSLTGHSLPVPHHVAMSHGDGPDLPDLLRRQWQALRRWLEDAHVLDAADRPSGLGDWSVGDLVAHLGFGIRMLTEITPAPVGAEPLSLRSYVGQYPPAAPVIAESTHELAGDLGADLLGGIDDLAAAAFAALERSTDPVVLGRRGPLTIDDYVLTRLIELVVHADDLARAVPGSGSAVLPEAAAAVGAALADAYREAAGDVAWIRRATGRVPSDDPHLPLL
jgi:uncharacterized protein (TIGR03083 family)